MEVAILAAEETLARCEAASNDPVIATGADELAARCREVEQARRAVGRLYGRGAELEATRA